jgi:predicted O-linked N-acetylglucosamine transferase (SPINDLY family)
METPAPGPLPALRAGHVTFGCLNNFCKASAPALDAWARILQQAPTARLLLHARQGMHRDRVWELFERHGVGRERIEFIDFMPMLEFYRAHERIDIALDPFPYGGGTTTCDALWQGVPVVSLVGQTAVGRGGLSILTNIGLPELAAASVDAYIETAASLARDTARLIELRHTLRDRMRASPLMDGPRFARNVEACYRKMWQAWCAGCSDGACDLL